jgi:hypothetical protein
MDADRSADQEMPLAGKKDVSTFHEVAKATAMATVRPVSAEARDV